MGSLVDETLLKHRMLFLGSRIDEDTAHRVVAALFLLNAEDPTEPIEIYINSAGGSVLDGLAIYDAMQAVEAPVATYCIGCALSMGAVLLAAGTPGMRYATPNARIMIHEPVLESASTGSLRAIEQTYQQMASFSRTLVDILSRHTGQSRKRIQADMRRTRWFTPQEALRYGFIDAIIPLRKPSTGESR